MMRVMILFKLLTLFFVMVSFAQETNSEIKQKSETMIIGIPYIEDLNFDPHREVYIDRPDLVRVTIQPQKRRIIFSGIKPGQTHAHITDQTGNIRIKLIFNITSTDQSKQLQNLQDYLGDVEGLEIGIKGGKVYVGGKIVVPDDVGKVVVVLSEMGEGVMRLVELAPQTQQVIARKMQDELHRQNMTNLTVRVVNGNYWIEGVVASEGESGRAIEIAERFLPDKIESLARQTGTVSTYKTGKSPIVPFITVNAKAAPPEIPKLVKITAQFVELKKDYLKKFAFQWNPTLSTGGTITLGKSGDSGLTSTSNKTLAGTISNLFPKLASAKNSGHLRVIQSGVLVAQDKVEASITKGTTDRYEVGSGEFTKEGVAEAGFTLKVKPSILQGELIQLQTGLDVNSNVATGGAPSTLKNSISTTVVVKSKESAVIGGIVVNSSQTDFDKDPPYGGSTINTEETPEAQTLFSFLRSKTYQSQKNQFVVFLTPQIIESASEGTEIIKKKFRKRGR